MRRSRLTEDHPIAAGALGGRGRLPLAYGRRGNAASTARRGLGEALRLALTGKRVQRQAREGLARVGRRWLGGLAGAAGLPCRTLLARSEGLAAGDPTALSETGRPLCGPRRRVASAPASVDKLGHRDGA